MGDFLQSIASGIVGLVSGALTVIGSTLRDIVASANAAMPGGLFALVVFVALLLGAWNLAKR